MLAVDRRIHHAHPSSSQAHTAAPSRTAASSARQALEFCATLRPDIVGTDLTVPDEDGVWLAEQLRAALRRGAAQPRGRRRNAAAPFARKLLKPIDGEDLCRVIAQVLQG